MKTISNIKFYKTNADVFTDEGCIMFSWDGLESNEEVMDAWRDFFDEHEISEESRDKWMPKCDRLYFN